VDAAQAAAASALHAAEVRVALLEGQLQVVEQERDLLQQQVRVSAIHIFYNVLCCYSCAHGVCVPSSCDMLLHASAACCLRASDWVVARCQAHATCGAASTEPPLLLLPLY
jgi:hypothetical protein